MHGTSVGDTGAPSRAGGQARWTAASTHGGHVQEHTDAHTHASREGRKDGHTDEHTAEHTAEHTDGRNDAHMKGLVDARVMRRALAPVQARKRCAADPQALRPRTVPSGASRRAQSGAASSAGIEPVRGIGARNPKLSEDDIRQVVRTYTDGALIHFGPSKPPPTVSVVQSTMGVDANTLDVTVSYTFEGIGLGTLFQALGRPWVLTSNTVMVHE